MVDRIDEEDADLFENGEPAGPGQNVDQGALRHLNSAARARDVAERDLMQAVTAARVKVKRESA